MISVSHLVRRFGSFTAVDDISFELERGDVVGFLGPNGAGKSTTMRMLTGFLPATRGSVEVAGYNVLTHSLEARRHIGYLPESVPLYREHRVEEMLLFQSRLHGMPRGEARRRIPEIVERVGMADRLRSTIGKLSKGQRQRIGLAVALLPDPEVLILDEPTSGLDPVQRIGVRALIRELAQDRTVLLSSHILPEVEAVCPRVIVLHRGRIAARGTPAELGGEMGGSFVRVEVLLDGQQDDAEVLDPLASLDGVSGVRRGPLGSGGSDPVPSPEGQAAGGAGERPPGERVLAVELECPMDLREAVGRLARDRGWTLRELAWRSPTLEELFARLALDLDAELDSALPRGDDVGPALEAARAAGEGSNASGEADPG